MECPINPAELLKLKGFVDLCQKSPQLLNLGQLDFFKKFVESLGGKVPEGQPDFANLGASAKTTSSNTPPSSHSTSGSASASAADSTTTAGEEPTTAGKGAESDPESDLELDNDGCVEPDTDPDQPMGDSSKEPTEEEFDQANDLRSQAACAYGEQKYDEAVKLFSSAIQLNPKSALYYAKRGQAYLKLQKPNACIRDCDRALEINPDSATAYKFRGRANRLLGHWEEAAKDLRQACKLDFDEEADEWLKEVTPNAKKIEQHKQKQDRRRKERELRERQERVRKAQEEKRKAQEEAAAGMGGGPGGMPDFDARAGADLFSAFRDPEVTAAMSDIFANPANISKYQNNPKIMNILMKLYSSPGGGVPGFPGAGGAGGAGGAPGGFPGFPGFAGGFPGFGGPDAGAGAGGGAAGTGAGAGAGAGTGTGGGARVDDLD
ncbi:hsc70-interacting protein 1-like [Anopheles cruzii]|uniref:hsc70-interacting protein 1-like n=1 Tax=Anopheles cruzii TaxID=68878 RepID=UPI0022EC804C|nr:hsc70-interacting protein 1-like [Anopheles cruzii]XP_052865519.1 hsc70-interacting protein 1-like [Anopheles cruzii]